MYLEKLNYLTKSKNDYVRIRKLNEYESLLSGVKAAEFYDELTNIKTKVVKIGKNNKLRHLLNADEFVMHTITNCGNMRSLILFDTKGKEIFVSHAQFDKNHRKIADGCRNFSEIRNFIKKLIEEKKEQL